MKPINLDTYSLSLLTAKEDILNPRSSTSWALFKYDGSTNNLKLSDSGAGGVSELIGKFEVNHPLYGLCRVEAKPSVHRIVMITWVGEGVDEYRRTECLSHVPAVKAFFKEAHVFVSATRPEDVTEEKISEIAGKIVTPAERIRRNPRVMEKDQPVGTNYRKTNAAMEIRRINRDSFWARAEREEEERKEDERRRAAEDRRRWERERIQQERREAEERDRKMDEKLQMIEEQRRMQANLEAEVRKQERAKWEQQQKEHEEDMRARFRRSESIEKAAEAAVLVSQRSINPREFFRQLSSSSTDMPPSPSSPRTGKPPFRRYQRSLTDTAFIFGKSDSSVPPSPHSPTVVSPFSRIPKSPFNQPKSPTSPSLADTPSHCLNSTPQPHDHLSSPLTSPKHSAPTSTLPSLPASKTTLLQSSLPHSSNLVKAEDHILSSPGFSTSFVQPLAAPASLGLLTSLSQPHKDPCGSSGSLNSTAEAEDLNVFPQTDVPLESEEDHTAYRMLTALDTDADMTVKAVLVDTSITPMAEEDEEEAEVLELVASTECKAPLKNLASTLASEESVSTGISILSTLESTTVSLQEDSHVEEKTSHRQECAPDMEAISTESRQCMENLVPVLDSISTVTLETNTEPLEENPRAQLIKTVRESQEDKEMSHSAMAVDHFAICQEPIHVQQTEVEEEHNTVHDLLEEHIITEVATEEDGDQMTVLEEVAVQQAKVMCDENTSQAENGLTEGHNGTEQSINPHGMVKNLSEITQDLVLTSCTIRHDRTEEDFIEEMVENEKSSPHEQLCVRALYDYQAEDESELSLEPGDIISAVETVDKAWWRGCSKDGRQGLFPANYVETIKGLPSI